MLRGGVKMVVLYDLDFTNLRYNLARKFGLEWLNMAEGNGIEVRANSVMLNGIKIEWDCLASWSESHDKIFQFICEQLESKTGLDIMYDIKREEA